MSPPPVRVDDAGAPGIMRRREWFRKLVGGVIGLGLLLVPLGSGLLFLLNPLRRRADQHGFSRVASVDSLPLGTPRHFMVRGRRRDAWEVGAQVPLGAVYLVRQETGIRAFQVICPHAGCFVGYEPADRRFLCPCHDSTFGLDGSIDDPDSPSPRGLDELEVKIEKGEVLVRYQEFRPGIGERVAVS